MSLYNKVFYFQDDQRAIRARVYGFDIGQSALKPAHIMFLHDQIVPILRNGGSLRLIGLASPTGNPSFNRSLSISRRDAVLRYLFSQAGTDFRIELADAQGDQAARLAGVRPGQENENWRSVIVSGWRQRIPPPEPIPPPLPPAPPPRYASESVWAGAGIKGGVTFVVGGGEQVAGVVVNLHTGQPALIGVSSLRIGPGFGTGGGLSLIFVFNALNIGIVDGTTTTDWSVNLSLGERWASLMRGFGRSSEYRNLFNLITKIRRQGRLDAGEMTQIRNLYSMVWTEHDVATMSSEPTVVVIDTPLGGGEEISASLLIGRVSATALTPGAIVNNR